MRLMFNATAQQMNEYQTPVCITDEFSQETVFGSIPWAVVERSQPKRRLEPENEEEERKLEEESAPPSLRHKKTTKRLNRSLSRLPTDSSASARI